MSHPPASPFRLIRLLAGLAALTAAARADNWAPNLTATATWHTNATNADRSANRFEALQTSADLLAGERYALGRDDALHFTGHLAGEWWPRYSELLRGALGGRAEWRHQFGTDPLAPSVALEGAADFVAARETGRRGVGTGITASVRKRFDALTRVTLRHEVSWFDARYGTFDSTANETSLDLDRDLAPTTRLTLTLRYRDGDLVTYASGPRPDLESRAPNRTELNTFDRLMTAYRLDAQTWSGRLALVRALDASSAVSVAYEHRDTRRGPLHFPDHQLSIALVHQF